MDKETAKARKGLRNIETIQDFEEVLSTIMLSEEEKEILRLHYRGNKTLAYIADTIGMSEANVKKIHRKMLLKISKLF